MQHEIIWCHFEICIIVWSFKVCQSSFVEMHNIVFQFYLANETKLQMGKLFK
uniref:Uncharacterized protein n=1 Tax=Octopus bimaculoides TaxID=37653 RepID=A0A0L8G5U2_OCTBM